MSGKKSRCWLTTNSPVRVWRWSNNRYKKLQDAEEYEVTNKTRWHNVALSLTGNITTTTCFGLLQNFLILQCLAKHAILGNVMFSVQSMCCSCWIHQYSQFGMSPYRAFIHTNHFELTWTRTRTNTVIPMPEWALVCTKSMQTYTGLNKHNRKGKHVKCRS